MPLTLTLNNQPVQVPDGATVLDAVNASGAYIFQLREDPDMEPIGVCRTCLVQIDGVRGFPASCSVPARRVWWCGPTYCRCAASASGSLN